MKRDGQQLDLIWVHLNMTGMNISQLRTQVRSKMQGDARTAACEPSINLKSDGSQSLVKVAAQAQWVSTLPAAIQNAVLAIFSESNFLQAYALVHSAAWSSEGT